MSSRYPYIIAWARDRQLYQHVISESMGAAASSNEPFDVVYQRPDGTWVRADDLPPDLKRRLDSIVETV